MAPGTFLMSDQLYTCLIVHPATGECSIMDISVKVDTGCAQDVQR